MYYVTTHWALNASSYGDHIQTQLSKARMPKWIGPIYMGLGPILMGLVFERERIFRYEIFIVFSSYGYFPKSLLLFSN